MLTSLGVGEGSGGGAEEPGGTPEPTAAQPDKHTAVASTQTASFKPKSARRILPMRVAICNCGRGRTIH